MCPTSDIVIVDVRRERRRRCCFFFPVGVYFCDVFCLFEKEKRQRERYKKKFSTAESGASKHKKSHHPSVRERKKG
jgi:hypothetical protein